MEFTERLGRNRLAKPNRMAASGLPIGMPLTSPSIFARACRSRFSRLRFSAEGGKIVFARAVEHPHRNRAIGHGVLFFANLPPSVRPHVNSLRANRSVRNAGGPDGLRF